MCKTHFYRNGTKYTVRWHDSEDYCTIDFDCDGTFVELFRLYQTCDNDDKHYVQRGFLGKKVQGTANLFNPESGEWHLKNIEDRVNGIRRACLGISIPLILRTKYCRALSGLLHSVAEKKRGPLWYEARQKIDGYVVGVLQMFDASDQCYEYLLFLFERIEKRSEDQEELYQSLRDVTYMLMKGEGSGRATDVYVGARP